jgi:spore germination protein YaaH
MEQKVKLAVIGSVTALIIIAIIVVSAIIKYMTPSKEEMPLTEYYPLEASEVLIILQNEIYENKGLLIEDKVYVDYDTVIQYFNHRFYWDYNENVLTYTTPDEIMKAEAGKEEYTVTKSTIETAVASDHPIVEVFADKVYLSLEFVEKYSDLTYQYYKEPSRVVIQYMWGDYLYTDVVKATQLRVEPSIKSPILMELAVGTKLMFVDADEAPKKGFVKVMTEDGVKGYVKDKSTKKSYYETLESDFQAPNYTAQTRAGKINMVFHQVFNLDATDNMKKLIQETKGVNVISPTWFSVSDEMGTLTSLATEQYVKAAGELGLEVWAAVDDFNANAEVDMTEVLSHTSRREALANSLIEMALQYKLNGINIDFERIYSEAGIHYVQFLRELSVKCRNNGIVLSVDSYVPSAYSEYYDREEQGIIADYVVVMAYNEYHANSEVPGPVSSIGFVKDAITNILTMVPKEKTIIAIPFYTRLWKETAEGEITSEYYSMTPAANIITDNGTEAVWDEASGCYYVEYTKEGATYRMWQEEDTSIEEKMKAIYEADLAGVAAWKLGLEKQSIWDVIIRYIN